MQLAFFVFFCIFCFGQKLNFIAFFLHFDATSAKERVSHKVGSCIFKTCHAGAEGAGDFFKCNLRIYKRISFKPLEVALFFALFCDFFCIAFF